MSGGRLGRKRGRSMIGQRQFGLRVHALARALFVAALVFASPALGQSRDTIEGMDAYNRGDIATAYRLLAEQARAGNAEAQVNLGYLYARGQGVAVNQITAFRLYEMSAAQGDSEGMNALGYKYQYGTGVAPDIAMAVHWYCKAVEAGNARAMNNLALLLDAGAGVPRDLDQARDLWRQSAASGHTSAMANLGFSYLKGTVGEKERAEALRWLKRAADGGQPKAQAYLRANGYAGPLPAPVDQAAKMIPTVRGVSGRARICGDFIS